jgi:putative peptide zinc metalloprotease protein
LVNYAITLVGVKLLHEFGHGLVAKRHGCRVPTMGLAFMVLWPMPYTDTNEAWKLADRWHRLQIASAGMATELIVAAWATLAWGLLPDGDLRSAAFLLATTTWVSTLLVNCSPFMRFDGYFVLSDFLEMPNLHARAFALARWRLREMLFNIGAEPPEQFPAWRARGLQLFAYAVWGYRLVLFLGIAALVYSFFIKLVGILLFVVEIVWFVLMPIASEVKVWRQLWPKIKRRRRTWLSALVLLAAIGLTAVPMPGHINAAGLLQTSQVQLIYAPAAGRIEKLMVADGALVQVGQRLLSFSADQVEQQLQSARSRVQRYSAEADAGAMRSELRAGLQVAKAQLSTAQAARRGLEARLQELAPTAPADGLLRWRDPDLRAGDWVAAREPVATLLSPRTWQVEAYLSESEIARIAPGSKARFYPDGRFGDPLSLTVASISHDATHLLPHSELAGVMGGTVAVREVEGRLIPEQAVYRVNLLATMQPAALAGQTWRGRVMVEAEPESLAERVGKAALALWWREAGW